MASRAASSSPLPRPAAGLSPIGKLPSEMSFSGMSQAGTMSSSKAKLMNLSTKLNDLDIDVTNQTRHRQLYKGKVETMSQELDYQNKSQRAIQTHLEEAEDRLQRLENLLNHERSSREQAAKNIQRQVEDRVAKLTAAVEAEEKERNAEIETMRQRIKFLEERNQHLELVCTESGREVEMLTRHVVPKVQTNLDTLHQAADQEKMSGGGGGDADTNRKFAVALSNLQTDLHTERCARERDNEMHKKDITSEIEYLKHLIEDEKKERGVMNDRIITPVWDQIRVIQAELEKEKSEREQSVAEQSQSLLNKLNVLKSGLERAAMNIDEQHEKKLKMLDDRLWQLATQLDQEIEARKISFADLESMLNAEKIDRASTEEEILNLMNSISDKIRSQLED